MKKNLFVIIIQIIITGFCFAQDIGDRAPNFSFPTLDHGRISLSDFKGKVIYLFLFGYNCPPCVAEGPIAEKQIYQKYKNKIFQAIGIDVWDGTINQMLNYKEQTGISFPLCLIGSSVLPLYKLTYDYSIVIDQNGLIRYLGPGVHTQQIKATIENLLSYNSLDKSITPKDFELNQNYPNPFNPSTLISFVVWKPQNISLTIYNEEGKWIRSLVNNNLLIGQYEFSWNGEDPFGKLAPSGIYFYVVQGRDFRESKKMILLY